MAVGSDSDKTGWMWGCGSGDLQGEVRKPQRTFSQREGPRLRVRLWLGTGKGGRDRKCLPVTLSLLVIQASELQLVYERTPSTSRPPMQPVLANVMNVGR